MSNALATLYEKGLMSAWKAIENILNTIHSNLYGYTHFHRAIDVHTKHFYVAAMMQSTDLLATIYLYRFSSHRKNRPAQSFCRIVCCENDITNNSLECIPSHLYVESKFEIFRKKKSKRKKTFHCLTSMIQYEMSTI